MNWIERITALDAEAGAALKRIMANGETLVSGGIAAHPVDASERVLNNGTINEKVKGNKQWQS